MTMVKFGSGIWTNMPKELFILLANKMNCQGAEDGRITAGACYAHFGLAGQIQDYGYKFYLKVEDEFKQIVPVKVDLRSYLNRGPDIFDNYDPMFGTDSSDN